MIPPEVKRLAEASRALVRLQDRQHNWLSADLFVAFDHLRDALLLYEAVVEQQSESGPRWTVNPNIPKNAIALVGPKQVALLDLETGEVHRLNR